MRALLQSVALVGLLTLLPHVSYAQEWCWENEWSGSWRFDIADDESRSAALDSAIEPILAEEGAARAVSGASWTDDDRRQFAEALRDILDDLFDVVRVWEAAIQARRDDFQRSDDEFLWAMRNAIGTNEIVSTDAPARVYAEEWVVAYAEGMCNRIEAAMRAEAAVVAAAAQDSSLTADQWFDMCEAEIALENYEAALRSAKVGLAMAGRTARSCYCVGVAKLCLVDVYANPYTCSRILQESIEALNEATAQDAKAWRHWAFLGVAYAVQGDAVKSESAFENAEELVPDEGGERAAFDRLKAVAAEHLD